MNEVRRILGEVLSVLKQHNSALEAGLIEKALEGADDDLRAFIISNELWGGAGSIADQALCGEPRGEATREVERLLAALGELQMQLGLVNIRTEMWTSTLRKWQKAGV